MALWAVYAAWLFTEQRRLIGNQERMQRAITEKAVPLLRDLRPLTDDVRGAQPGLQGGLRRADRLVRETRPLVRELRPVTRDTASLLAELDAVDLRGILDASGEASEATVDALTEVRRRDLVRRLATLADRADRDLPRLVRIQAETLAIQRRTLAVQEEALQRLRSIDQRTGGGVTPAGGAAAGGAGGAAAGATGAAGATQPASALP